MKRWARYRTTFQKLLEYETLKTSSLHQQLGISKETLRKDLAELEAKGLIYRPYGKIKVRNPEKLQLFLREQGLLSKDMRLLAIEELLMTKDRIRISHLAKMFSVSPITIRKDLQELRESSTVIKNHGEALYDRENSVRKSVASRAISISKSEEKIAKRVLTIIRPGQTIYLDESACSAFIASHILLESNVQILTPSFNVIQKLMERAYKSPVVLLPSRIHPQENRLVLHERAQEILESYHIGLAIFMTRSFDGFAWKMEYASEAHNFMIVLPLADRTILCLRSNWIEENHQQPKQQLHHISIPTIFRHTVEVLTDNDGDDQSYEQLRQTQLPVYICGNKNHVRSLTAINKKKIGFLYSVSGTSDGKMVNSSIERAINRDGEYTLIEMGVTDERKNILSCVQAMLAEHIDILVMYITNFETGQYIASRFSQEEIISISIDIALPHSTFFGVDNYHAGNIAGNHIVNFISAKWNGYIDKIIIFGIQTAGPLARQRISAIIDELRKVIIIEDSNLLQFDFEMLRKMTGEQIAHIVAPSLGKRNLCISFNEKTTFLMNDMIPHLPHPEDIIIIGHNYNERIERLMSEPGSRLLGCVHYHPDLYGDQVVDLIHGYEESNSIPSVKYTHLSWIGNNHNLEFYKID